MKNLSSLLLILVFSVLTAQKTERSPLTEIPSPESLRAGAFIDVNSNNHPESSWTIEKLIKDVLITGGGACSNPEISNVKVSPNLQATSVNRSWGYFNSGTTAFPFEEGIILTTGYARNAGNVLISSALSDNLPTGSDDDLAQVVPGVSLYNATYIEFDFVPQSSQVTFNYIFASEEYTGSFPCTYTDAFALLLKKVGDPNYINLAVLPDGKGPVAVTNIVPDDYYCGPINEEYFEGHFSTETNFRGRTIPLRASATVEPGVKYRFKMVLADADDYNYDSGVFLEAGSFNFGVQFQDEAGVSLPDSITMCNLTPQTLVAITNDTNAQFKWYQNNNLIPSATTNTYTATDPGIYKVEVYIPNNNCPGEATVEIIGGTFPTVSSSVLKKCATTPNATTATFNLTEAESALSSTPGVTFRYYLTESYALAGNNIFIKNPAAFNSVTTRLYVRVSNGDCAKVTELDLVVNPMPPKPTITKSANSICAETPVILTSSSPTGNLWSTGETTQSISVTTPGVYTLTYKDGNNCQSPSSFVVISKTENPNVQISGNLVFCEGSSTTLTSSSTTGNEWSTGETTQSIIVNTPGIYTVTVTTESGCTFSESVNVTETGATTVNIAAPQKITCTVDQVMLDATTSVYEEGSTFLWAASNGGNIVSGGNTLQPIVNKAGTYTLTITGTVCTASKSVVVTADMSVTAPVITANRNIICPGETVTLTSSYATGNVWSTGATTQSITVSSAGTYTLKTNVGSCTSATVSYTVTSATDPNIQISGNLSFCEGSSTVLTSSVANGNIWSNGETTQSITVTAPGVYTVQVTTAQGCTFEKSVTVTRIPKTIVNIAATQQITCTVTQITLDATASVYQTGSTFAWTASNGGNIVSGGNTLQPVVNKAGTYTLLISGHCPESKTVTVTEDTNAPTVSFNASATSICVGEGVTLSVSGASNYVWSNQLGTSSTIAVSPTETTTYTVTATGSNGCTTTESITITVVPKVISSLPQISGQMCSGDAILLDAGAGPNYTYLWSTGENTQTISANQVGEYSVTISNGVCSETFTTEILQTQLPTITEIIYANNEVRIIAVNNSEGELEYSLDGYSWQSSPIFFNVQPNIVVNASVRIKTTSCLVSTEYFTFKMANVLTPNGDGRNDVVDFTGISYYTNFTAIIYDRNGEVVYKADNNRTVWDGKEFGRPLPTSSYWYTVIWDDPVTQVTQTKIGWILLKND